MKRLLSLGCACLATIGLVAQDLKSPNEEFNLHFELDNSGRPTYSLTYKGVPHDNQRYTS